MNTAAATSNDDTIEYTFDWNADKYLIETSGVHPFANLEDAVAYDKSKARGEAKYLLG